MGGMNGIRQILERIYGLEKGAAAFGQILPLIEAFPRRADIKGRFFSQADAVLITYGDSLKKTAEAPLVTCVILPIHTLGTFFHTSISSPSFPIPLTGVSRWSTSGP